MTANTSRVLIAAGFVTAGAAIMLTTPPMGKGDFLDGVFGWIAIAAMAFFFVVDVKEWLADRREHRNAAGKSTAIQTLPEDGESVTLHFPEGGAR